MVLVTLAAAAVGFTVGALLPAAIPAGIAGIAGSAALGGAILYGTIATAQYVVNKALVKKRSAAFPQLKSNTPSSVGGQPSSTYAPDTLRSLQIQGTADAQWIVGTARTGGMLIWANESIGRRSQRERRYAPSEEYPGGRIEVSHYISASTLNLCILLSEGPCENLRAVYIDDYQVPLKRGTKSYSDSDHYVPSSGKYSTRDQYGDYDFEIWFYSNGGDSPPQSLRSVSSSYWDSEHTGKDLCFVHVKLRQGPYNIELAETARVWTEWPSLNFVVDGIKITWPGQMTPRWTKNSAAIRYWWERNRRGRPAEAFNENSVKAAISTCSDKDYTIDGVITSGDDLDTVASEMDFTWQGELIEIDGKLNFRPGRDVPSTVTDLSSFSGTSFVGPQVVALNVQEEAMESLGVKPAPAINERVNALTMSIAQSEDHDYLPIDIDAVRDEDAIARDGEYRPSDIGTKAFILDPTHAKRLMIIALRRSRASAIYTYRLRAGENFKNVKIFPGDIILLTDSEYGLINARMLVTSQTFHEDWSATLSMIENSDSTFEESNVLPPLQPRNLAPAIDASVPPSPKNLSVTNEVFINQEGNITTRIIATWDGENYIAFVRLTGENGYTNSMAISSNRAVFEVPTAQEYTVYVKHRSIQRLDSPEVSGSTTPDWSTLRVDAPVPVSFRSYPGFVHVILRAVSNRDITGLEARYRFEEIDETADLDAIETDQQWDALDRLDISTLVPSINNQGMFVSILIPETGRYRIAARYVTRQGILGDIGDFGQQIYTAPRSNEGTLVAQPLFSGQMENLSAFGNPDLGLVYEPGTLNLTRATWNGENGWPFGALPSGSSGSYITRSVTLDEAQSVSAQGLIEFHKPSQTVVPDDDDLLDYLTLTMQTKATENAVSWTETEIDTESYTNLPVSLIIRLKVSVDEGFEDASLIGIGFNYRTIA